MWTELSWSVLFFSMPFVFKFSYRLKSCPSLLSVLSHLTPYGSRIFDVILCYLHVLFSFIIPVSALLLSFPFSCNLQLINYNFDDKCFFSFSHRLINSRRLSAEVPLEMVICRKPRSPRHLVKKRKVVMDELLLGSHLRRVDEGGNDGILAGKGLIHILKEKPTTPYVVLPNEPRFESLLRKSRYALDIGGTLVKLVYSSVVSCDEDGCLQVLLNFKKFMSIDECLLFVKENWNGRSPNDVIHCTGGGSFKHAQHLNDVLGVKVKRTDEMHSLIFGCDFLLQNNEDESFTYHHEAVGVERFQYKPTSKETIYPFLLVNIGTGISILKVDSPTSFQRVGGSSMGGGAFIGLGSLLTEAKDFDELLLMAEKGDHRKCDTLVSDIYGGGYECMGLSADLIAGSFGKCNPRKATVNSPTGADIAKSLLLMISNNIGQMAMLYGHRYNMKRIYFGGFFIRKHPITMRTLTYAINFWSKGEVQALFMKHEGYLGAVGAFLDE